MKRSGAFRARSKLDGVSPVAKVGQETKILATLDVLGWDMGANRIWQLIPIMDKHGWRAPIVGPEACGWHDADGRLAGCSLTVDGYLRVHDGDGRLILSHAEVEAAEQILLDLVKNRHLPQRPVGPEREMLRVLTKVRGFLLSEREHFIMSFCIQVYAETRNVNAIRIGDGEAETFYDLDSMEPDERAFYDEVNSLLTEVDAAINLATE